VLLVYRYAVCNVGLMSEKAVSSASRADVSAAFRAELDAKSKESGGPVPTWNSASTPAAATPAVALPLAVMQCGVDVLLSNPDLLRDCGRIAVVSNQGCTGNAASGCDLSANIVFKAAEKTTYVNFCLLCSCK
jgi:hypothetical protein